jgi:ABC-type enterochelin transport system permease subunit
MAAIDHVAVVRWGRPKDGYVALGVTPSKLESIEDVLVAVIQASVYCLVGMPDDVKVVVPNPL